MEAKGNAINEVCAATKVGGPSSVLYENRKAGEKTSQ
jgi:hypothetical protein